MTNLFRTMGREERAEFERIYVSEMRARDGEPDAELRTLAARERFFREEIEGRPVRWEGQPPVDVAAYRRNLDRYRPEPGLDERTLWVLATAKINRGERYGVELGLERRGTGALADDDPHTYQELQELYHTRILRDAVETLGLEMSMAPPEPGLRRIIGAMTSLPRPLANVLIFVAELVGATVFGMMLQRGRQLFAQQPLVVQRIGSLYAQILTDEVGHVRLMRSTLGPLQLGVARLLVGPMARHMVRSMPEVDRLFDRREIARHAQTADLAWLDGLALAA